MQKELAHASSELRLMQGKLELYAHDDDPLVSRDLEECSVLNVCFHQIYDVVLRQKAIGKSASLLFHSINLLYSSLSIEP